MPGGGLDSYYLAVWTRAWRKTAAFLLRQGIPLGLDLMTGEKGPGDFVYVHRLS